MKNGARLLASVVFTTLLTIARVSHAQPKQQGELLYERQQYAAAMPLLKQSAKSGNAQAQSTLGVMYREGQGVREDDRIAAHWFQQAAAQGEAAAQYQLGVMYEDGKGRLPRDDRRAIDLYIRSSQQGFVPAQLMLGTNYDSAKDCHAAVRKPSHCYVRLARKATSWSVR